MFLSLLAFVTVSQGAAKHVKRAVSWDRDTLCFDIGILEKYKPPVAV